MKKKTGVVLSSVAAIALSASLIAGSTFALFTSESKTNIAVTSGKVALTAQAEIVDVYSPKTVGETGAENNAAVKNEDGSYTLANGGAVSKDGNGLNLNGIAPGDVVTVKLSGKNDSTIAAKYRWGFLTEAVKDGTLAGAQKLVSSFKIAVGDSLEALDANEKETGYVGYKSVYADVEQGKATKDLYIRFAFPEENEDADGLKGNIAFLLEGIQSNAKVEGEAVWYNAVAADEETLTAAIAEGGMVILTENVTVGSVMNVNENTQLDIGDNTVEYVPGSGVSRSVDATRPFVIEAGSELTVTANNGSIICNTSYVYGIFDVFGTLNIYGGNYETNGNGDGAIVRGRPGSKTNIYGGSYIDNGFNAAVNDEGDIYIEDGYFYTNSSNRGAYNYCVRNTGGSMHIKDATVFGIQGGIAAVAGTCVIDNCTVEVRDIFTKDDGRQESFYALYVNGEEDSITCIVNGGSFTAEYRSAVRIGNSTPIDGGLRLPAHIIINGGTFNGGSLDSMNCVTIDNYNGTGVICGGTYNKDISALVNTDTHEIVVNDDGTWTVSAKA